MQVKDQDEKVIRTACFICPIQCGMLAHVKDGVLTKVEPADYPEPQYRHICAKGLCIPKQVYHPDRLKYPMKRTGERGEGKWERISWDEALDTIADKFKGIAERYRQEAVAYVNGGISVPNGGHFIGRRFVNTLGGTMPSLTGSGSAGQGCANKLSYGASGLETYLMGHDDPRLCVYWGANTLVTAKWKYFRFKEAREKGAKIVVISPLFTPTAAKADEWIPIKPRTDAALALGMINIIVSEGLHDEPFITEHTVGPFLVRDDNGLFLREEVPSGDSPGQYMVWDTKTNTPQPHNTPGVAPALIGNYTADGIGCRPAFQLLVESVEKYPLKKVSEITEIPSDVIRRLALDYATLKPVVSDKGLGLGRTFRGDLAHRAITTLAAVTGNVRIQPTDVNVFPIMGWGPFIAPAGKIVPEIHTLQFYETALTGKPHPIKGLWLTNHSLANAHGNRNKIKAVMSQMEFTVVVDIFMGPNSEYADIVLPGCTPFESTNMALPYGYFYGGHPYLQLQSKVIEPYHESKPDLEIFTELAKRMGIGEHFDKNEEEYIEMLLSGNPALEDITLEKLREGPMKAKPYPVPTFNTPSRRLEFYVEKMKEFGEELPIYIDPLGRDVQAVTDTHPLAFFSTHAKHREHSILGNVDWMRELDPEPELYINSIDAQKRGIQDGDMVLAFNDRGKAKAKARIHEGMRPGGVSMTEGWLPGDFAEGSHQELTGSDISQSQETSHESMAQMHAVPIEVKKV